ACSTCSRAGPDVPIGKNSSGSSSRQAARWRQSDMAATLLGLRIGGSECARTFPICISRVPTVRGEPGRAAAREQATRFACEYFHELWRCQGGVNEKLGARE